MAPDVATKHNYCHHRQGKISKKLFQKAEEKVSEPLLVFCDFKHLSRVHAIAQNKNITE